MGCGCNKQSKEAKEYAKIKQLATKFGRATGKVVAIYPVAGGYSFAEKGYELTQALEFIYPV